MFSNRRTAHKRLLSDCFETPPHDAHLFSLSEPQKTFCQPLGFLNGSKQDSTHGGSGGGHWNKGSARIYLLGAVTVCPNRRIVFEANFNKPRKRLA